MWQVTQRREWRRRRTQAPLSRQLLLRTKHGRSLANQTATPKQMKGRERVAGDRARIRLRAQRDGSFVPVHPVRRAATELGTAAG